MLHQQRYTFLLRLQLYVLMIICVTLQRIQKPLGESPYFVSLNILFLVNGTKEVSFISFWVIVVNEPYTDQLYLQNWLGFSLPQFTLIAEYLKRFSWSKTCYNKQNLKTKQQNPLSFCLFLLASMTSRSLQTVLCMREAWKEETYVRCQSFSSESAVKYLNLEQRKIQIYLPLGEQDQWHGQCVFAISNNSHKFQRQFPPNFQLSGIPRNSEKFPLVFSPFLKYSQIFQGF